MVVIKIQAAATATEVFLYLSVHHKSTCLQMEQIQSSCYSPWCGRPAKITPRAQHASVKAVKKNPRVTLKHLQKCLQLYICLCVHYKKKTPGLTGEGAPWFGAVLLTQRLRDNDQHKETHKEENSCFKITKIGYFNLMETSMTWARLFNQASLKYRWAEKCLWEGDSHSLMS